MTAVREVDDSLAAYQAQRARLKDLGLAMLAAQRAVQLATERYNRGLTDFLNVVDAERQYYEHAGAACTPAPRWRRARSIVAAVQESRGGGGWAELSQGCPADPPARSRQSSPRSGARSGAASHEARRPHRWDSRRAAPCARAGVRWGRRDRLALYRRLFAGLGRLGGLEELPGRIAEISGEVRALAARGTRACEPPNPRERAAAQVVWSTLNGLGDDALSRKSRRGGAAASGGARAPHGVAES